MFPRPVRQTLALLLTVTVAGTIWFALSTSARIFSKSSRSLRQAVQSSKSVRLQRERLRSATNNPEVAAERQQTLKRFEDLRKTLDPQKLKDLLPSLSPSVNESVPSGENK